MSVTKEAKQYLDNRGLRAVTIEEAAYALRTEPNNVRALVKTKLIKTVNFSSTTLIFPNELERFQIENAGTDFSDIIADYKYQEKLIKEAGK